MLQTTIAGSLPKPSWLAEPERLWAPWRLPPETLAEGQPTTKPSAPWATASSASCTAAYATTPSTAKTPPGHIATSPKPLDELRPWDV